MEPWREEVRNELMHSGILNMRWGFSKGKRNGKRTKMSDIEYKARAAEAEIRRNSAKEAAGQGYVGLSNSTEHPNGYTAYAHTRHILSDTKAYEKYARKAKIKNFLTKTFRPKKTMSAQTNSHEISGRTIKTGDNTYTFEKIYGKSAKKKKKK